MSTEPTQRMPIVVLISGRGSNLQAILDTTANGELPVEIEAVVSNRPGVAGLERARRAGVTALELDHKAFSERTAFDQALRDLLDRFRPKLLVLAGFMRILGPEFVAHYHGRMLNIHPSLLPKFTGLDTHRRALEAGEPLHGASVHFVTDALDGGPLVVQARVPVLDGDDEDRLAERVLEREHVILPMAIRWFAEGRLRMENEAVTLDGQTLTIPKVLDFNVDTQIANEL